MIYLDNAATTFIKPDRAVYEAYRCIKQYCGNPGRSSHSLSIAASEKIYSCRESISRLFHYGSEENIIFTMNATYAINLAVKCLVKKGTHILISDIEHNAVYRPIYSLKEEGVATFDIYKTDGDVIENIKSKITPNTKTLIANHISNVFGRKLPIYEIGKLCRERSVNFIIDASQSAGHTDIDFQKTNAKALAAPGHKGLFGIQGCGFLILKDSEDMKTFIEGGGGSDSKNPLMSDYLPERYEAGTLPTPSIAALDEGVKYILSRGVSDIEVYEKSLSTYALEMLSSIPDIILYPEKQENNGVIAFNHKKLNSVELSRILSDRGIYTRGGFHCAPLAHEALGTYDTGCVRASLSCFNVKKDITALWKELKKI